MTNNEVNRLRLVIASRVMELETSGLGRDAIVIKSSADEFDRRLQAAQREAAVLGLEAAFNEKRAARAALRRIREGGYGICVECEEPIAPARLAALPWVPLCLHCQKSADRHREERNSRLMLPIAA